MDFKLPEELELVRQTARRFVMRELHTHEAAIDAADAAPEELMTRLRTKAVALGLYAYNFPASLGGAGLSLLGQAVVAEELGRTSVPLAETFGFLPDTLQLCSPAQRSTLLDPLVQGKRTVAYGMTEPNAGSDVSAIEMRAVRTTGGWLLNGTKQFITGGAVADDVIFLAVTNSAAALKERLTTFVVPKGAEGFHPPQPLRKMGWKGHDFSVLVLEDCFVPDGSVLGGVGNGFAGIMMTVNSSRIYVAGKCVGMAQHALALARDWAIQRKTFGKALADHEAVQMKLADMDVDVEAARLLLYRAAVSGDDGDPDFRIATSRAKLFASEMAGRVIDEALQIFGGAGYTADLPLERLYRDVRAFRIGEGTSEIQRLQIARHLLKVGYPTWGPIT